MITIDNLCFSYTNKKPYLLNNINLTIPKGAYVSVVGENGSCKTTLIKLILGLLAPTSGSITVKSNLVSYVPQKLDTFNSQFPITVNEVLTCHKKVLKNSEININSILENVNMLEFKEKLLGNLSGGQQQRVLIARALMGNPEVIILDEPSTGVDEANQLEIYNILEKLNRINNKTIISIEHNIEIALKYSTHILKVHNGKISLFTTEEFNKIRQKDLRFNNAM